MAKVIGIDLGTTNSCVAVMEGDQAKVMVDGGFCRGTDLVKAVALGAKNILKWHTTYRQIRFKMGDGRNTIS